MAPHDPDAPAAAACEHAFSSAVRERGRRYAREGRVRIAELSASSIAGEIRGSRPRPYRAAVGLAESGDALVVGCSCPHAEGGSPCKHLWGLLLEGGDALDLPGGGPAAVMLVTDRGGEWFGAEHRERGDRGRAPAIPEWRRLVDYAAQAAHAEADMSALRPTRSAPLEYWLDPDPGFFTGELRVDFIERPLRKDGTPGKPRPVAIDPDEGTDAFPPEDRDLLARLLGAGPVGRTDVPLFEPRSGAMVWAPLWGELVPALCATGRLLWGERTRGAPEPRKLSWDGGDPYQFSLELASNEDDIVVTGVLERPGASIPLGRVQRLVWPELVIADDVIARADLRDAAGWAEILSRRGAVRVPRGDRAALLSALGEAPRVPPLRGEPGLVPALERRSPAPRLRVASPPGAGRLAHLDAEVSFDYGAGDIAGGAERGARYDPDRDTLIERDRDAERAHVADLAELGIALRAEAGALGGRVSPQQFSRAAGELLRRGWNVEAEGRPVRAGGAPRVNLTSGADWFGLSGEIDFGDGARAELPELLAAAKRGSHTVRLGDGSTGMLPEAWLATLTALGALGQSDHAGGLVFERSQALLVDALLANKGEVDVDASFERLRRALDQGARVEPRRAPRGFRGTLRGYQEQGLGWLTALGRLGLGGCLADDMGLGKTVQVLALLQGRRLRGAGRGSSRPRPSIAVVPKSLVWGWREEAERFAPNLRVAEYLGRDRAEIRAHIHELDLVITTYGTLRRDIASLADVRFDYAILDEAQAIKNPSSQAAKACRLLEADHRLALTGTPIENHVGDLGSIFEFLNPGFLGRSSAFQALARGTGGDEARAALARAVGPFMLRRTKEQVLAELPHKTEHTLACELARGERRHYEELRRHYRDALARRIDEQGLARSRIQVLEALLRLRQAACHPGLVDRDRLDESSTKLDLLAETLAEVTESGHKALVFSQFTTLLGAARRRLERAGITCEYLDGKTRDRRARVVRFQDDPSVQAFLISLKAGGHGLNLTAADYVFLLDPWWNPAVEAQAIDRTHRIGQTRPVFAYRLIARETVEEGILALQQEKRELADAIVSGAGSALRQLTRDDIDRLLV